MHFFLLILSKFSINSSIWKQGRILSGSGSHCCVAGWCTLFSTLVHSWFLWYNSLLRCTGGFSSFDQTHFVWHSYLNSWSSCLYIFISCSSSWKSAKWCAVFWSFSLILMAKQFVLWICCNAIQPWQMNSGAAQIILDSVANPQPVSKWCYTIHKWKRLPNHNRGRVHINYRNNWNVA